MKNQELIAENADLRALLRSMQVCPHTELLFAEIPTCRQVVNATCFSFAGVSLILPGLILNLPSTFAVIIQSM